jgi:hypothetical protein
LIVPGSVECIGDEAFSGCGLGELEFERNSKLKHTGSMVLDGCETLVSIRLPDSLESIPDKFFGSSGIRSVTWARGVYEILDFLLVGDGRSRLVQTLCPASVSEVIIPSEIEIMCYRCFSRCQTLRHVSFGPSSKLRQIETEAFEGCGSLARITLPRTVEFIGRRAFSRSLGIEVIFESPSKLKTLEDEVLW